MSTSKNRIVLAFSGGLDTSVILKWLQEEKNAEIFTFTADLGQGEEVEAAREKALILGIPKENIFVEDVREEFIRDYAFPVFRANAIYEGYYFMGTPIARPIVAKRQIEIAKQVGATHVAHGATGKGNDQLRFEHCYYALNPEIKVVAPWREWSLGGRLDLIKYADVHGIPVARDKRGEQPYSIDANLISCSAEGKALEDPWAEAPEDVYTRTVSPEAAPNIPEYVEVEFEHGDPVAVNGKRLSPASLIQELNQIGGRNGIGRLDIVDTRKTGIKSRGIFETPGVTVLQMAHRALESITLDGPQYHLKDDLLSKYSSTIYEGLWFSPERKMIQALIDESQRFVTGVSRLKLYKGGMHVVGRKSAQSLYSLNYSTFEKDEVFSQADATGYINVSALRLKMLANRQYE